MSVNNRIDALYHFDRSLQVWEQTGRRHSEVLTEQQQQVGGSKLGGGLRYKNTAILWITCQQ
ncbi:hypothetical protein SK128_017763, partial [Halocaridina rubra]